MSGVNTLAYIIDSLKRRLGLFPSELLGAHVGEIWAMTFPNGGGWLGAVRTPLGLFTHKEGRVRYRPRGVLYSSSEREPSLPEEWAALRWGSELMVFQATGKTPPTFWSPSGLLYNSFWGKDFLVQEWKRGDREGEREYLDIWTPLFFCRLDQKEEPESWWRFYDVLYRNSGHRSGRVFEVPARYKEIFSLTPLAVREHIAVKQIGLT